MVKIIDFVNAEILRIEKILKKVDTFLMKAPKGCLKWQHKGGKTYYYHQYLNDNNTEEHDSDMKESFDRKSAGWKRKYIKKEEIILAQKLAQKHYYVMLKPILEKNLKTLKHFAKEYKQESIDRIFDDLSEERKELILPVQMSIKGKIKKWQEETYEKNNMYSENLRYETEQGEFVRSKSEVIIANILYQYRKDILYKYERPLKVIVDGKPKIIYPDFTILNVRTGKVTYWEHAGRMDDPYYANEFVKKMNTYMANDLLPGDDVILTFETQGNGLDMGG